MYDVPQIQDEFLGLVGLRQTSNPVFTTLPDTIVKSANNVLIQHPLLNIENIDMCARSYADWDYDTWEDSEEYSEGDRVKVEGTIYESLQDANENHAITDTDWWETVSPLALYLEDVFRGGIDDVVNNFVNQKKLRSETKTLLDNVILFEGAGNKNDLVINEHYLVGFAVQLKYSRNLLTMIKRIGHQFTQAGNLTLWIYHSSQQDPIATVTVARTKINSLEWHTPAAALNLRYVGSAHDAGGTFFIMYDQDATPGQAINKLRRNGWSVGPCSTCNGNDKRWWRMYSRYMSIRACRVAPADRQVVVDSPDTLWDIDKTQFVETDNFGLNFELMARCDMTEMLIQHKDIFAMALRDQITVKLLETLSTSTRQNADQTKVAPFALSALQARSVGGGGAREDAEKQVKAIDFEFSGFDDYCMPCKGSGTGLKYGAATLQ